jgi:hypothetical protein
MQALGIHANDEGAHVFPGLRLIASKTGYSERQVKRIMAELLKLGALILVTPATRSRPNEYRVDFSAVPIKPSLSSDKMSSNRVLDDATFCPDVGKSCPDEEKSCPNEGKSCPNEGTSETGLGDICHNHIRKNGHEPSRNKPFRLTSAPDEDSAPIDPRHHPIRVLIQELHREKFLVTCTWDGKEGKALADLLRGNPRWTEEQLTRMVRNRFASDGVKSDRPWFWISSLGSFAGGALDRYGKTKSEGSGNGHGKLSPDQIYKRECAILRARA